MSNRPDLKERDELQISTLISKDPFESQNWSALQILVTVSPKRLPSIDIYSSNDYPNSKVEEKVPIDSLEISKVNDLNNQEFLTWQFRSHSELPFGRDSFSLERGFFLTLSSRLLHHKLDGPVNVSLLHYLTSPHKLSIVEESKGDSQKANVVILIRRWRTTSTIWQPVSESDEELTTRSSFSRRTTADKTTSPVDYESTDQEVYSPSQLRTTNYFTSSDPSSMAEETGTESENPASGINNFSLIASWIAVMLLILIGVATPVFIWLLSRKKRNDVAPDNESND